MGRVMAWRAVVVAVASGSLLASACSSSKAGVTAARPTIATAVASTTTTDPYAVPPVIDVAYVNRVLAGLDAAVGDVVRFVVKTNPAPHEITLRLKPFYSDAALAVELGYFHQNAMDNFKGYRSSPGNRQSSVSELITATTTCIFVKVTRDFRAVTDNPNVKLAEEWTGLVPLDPTRDSNHVNLTGWSYVYDGYKEDHTVPPNPCAASS